MMMKMMLLVMVMVMIMVAIMTMMMMMVLQEGKIYSYSEQAGSINKDCCNSQSSPGRHSPKQFSAQDSFFGYFLVYFLFFIFSGLFPIFYPPYLTGAPH